MRWRLGQWAGIPIYLSVDFLGFLFLAFPFFQQTYREELQFLSLGTTLLSITSVLLLALLLVLHEWAHIHSARRYGNEATAIQLNYFGAVATLAREMMTPGEEFHVALVGPLFNVVSALACTTIHTGAGVMLREGGSLSRVQWSGITYAVSGVCESINWGIALFNLLPFFPLDGGRVLRSAVWALTGQKRAATVVAFCFTAAGTILFGLLAFHSFRRGQEEAGLRWISFALLLAIFLGSNFKRDRIAKVEDQL